MLSQYFKEIGTGLLISLLAGFGGCLSTGCALLMPGESVRRGMEQSKIYEWRTDGGFWVEAKGTHTESFMMLEGELVMKEGDDGKPVVDFERSRVTHYLAADPNVDVAGTAMGQAFEASTAQMKMFSDLVAGLMPLIPIPGNSAVDETP